MAYLLGTADLLLPLKRRINRLNCERIGSRRIREARKVIKILRTDRSRRPPRPPSPYRFKVKQRFLVAFTFLKEPKGFALLRLHRGAFVLSRLHGQS